MRQEGGGSEKTGTFTVHYITVLAENTPLRLTSVGKTPIKLLVQKQHLHHAVTQQQIQPLNSDRLLKLHSVLAQVKFTAYYAMKVKLLLNILYNEKGNIMRHS